MDRQPEAGSGWTRADQSAPQPRAERDQAKDGSWPRSTRHIERLDAFEIPNTLLHGDIHSGNTIRNGDDFWYIDWSDAAVGHPFVDMFTIRLTSRGAEASSSATRTSMNGRSRPEEPTCSDAWDAAGVVLAAHHAISYTALVSAIEPPVERDLIEMIPRWLSRMIDAANAVPMRE